jgi:5-formyltetrahydrofolate cyclo-ligase
MLKKAARKYYREKRLALNEHEQTRLDDLLLIQFQTVHIPFVNTLLSYWPIEENREPDTHLFTEFLKFRNPELKVCYPVSDFDSLHMQAIATDIDTPFEKKRMNIYEPDRGEPIPIGAIDMVFVPLLAFDRDGFRVGYGKGFYDMYLSGCREDCMKIGFSYFEPIDRIEDRSDFDVPLNLCITPDNFYVF